MATRYNIHIWQVNKSRGKSDRIRDESMIRGISVSSLVIGTSLEREETAADMKICLWVAGWRRDEVGGCKEVLFGSPRASVPHDQYTDWRRAPSLFLLALQPVI